MEDWYEFPGTSVARKILGGIGNGEGRFHGDDTHDGQPVKVVYLWSRIAPASCRWARNFSRDGAEWETNWVMEFTRA